MILLQKCAGVAEWQTHQTQNLTGATSCRFESGCRHSLAGAKPKTPSSFLVTRRLDGVFLFHRILHFWEEKVISAQSRGRILHFWGEKVISAQNRGRILHFRREKVISAQNRGRILHFWEEKMISAQNRGRILHFWEEKMISAQSRGRILRFWGEKVISAQNHEVSMIKSILQGRNYH